MDFLDNIKEETLIISNKDLKDKIIKIKKLLPISFISIDEFISKYYFTYDENAIIYLMNKYDMRYKVAKAYLDNLYYVKDIEYNNSKLDYLVALKKELTNENLLIFNNKFHTYIKRIKIILYDIPLNDFIMTTIKDLNYEIINREYHEYTHNAHQFDTMEEEIAYVATEISKLLAKGIDINKIKLTNITSEYYNSLERIFSLYNLKVAINRENTLYNYQFIKDFINELDHTNLDTAIAKLDKNNPLYNELINTINKYLKYDNKNLLIYKIKNTTIESPKYTSAIEIVDYYTYQSNDDEYIFMLNFNDGIIPKYEIDNKYITDNITSLVGLNTTTKNNEYIYNKTILTINDIKNLVITYKLRDFKNSYYPSELTEKYPITSNDIDYHTTYSDIYNKLLLAKNYDNYYKYGIKDSTFDLLRNNYQINYNSYNHKYTKINREMDKLTLSYSKMQIYNKCAFRYYLSDILKLDIFEENFSTNIGSMIHYILEKCLKNNDYNAEKYADEYLKDKVFTKKEAFFLQKYKEAINDLLQEIILEKNYSLFNQALYEKKIDIDYGNNVHFVGIIDKVLYYIDDDTTYIALIDYKTGMDDISLKYLKYGLNIQLPIYLYLSTKLDFSNIKYSGFYLQKFNIIDKDYRLVGYSNSNIDTLKIMDNNYANSKIIKSLKVNNDGSFAKNSKVLSDTEIEEIKVEVKKQIANVIENIKNNKFDINPKRSEGKNIGCEFCQYKDICFVTKDDEVELDLTLSGGDD